MNHLKRIPLPVLFLAAVFASALPANADTVAWRTSMKQAAADAEKSGKPMLIQFTAEWCGYCHKMLRETYTDATVIKQVNQHFIPVVLDADEHERLVSVIGVSAFPTTVILSPQLDVEARIEGFYRPAGFTRQIQAHFGRPRENHLNVADSTPAKTETASLKQPIRKTTAREEAPPEDVRPDSPPATDAAAFDGLCLVSLLNARRFEHGVPEFTYVFRGMKLTFASEANRHEFISNPEKYWPLADGQCPVATVNAEKDTTGDVRTVAVFRNRLVMFHSLSHRSEFATRPGDYLARLNATLQAGR